MTDPSSIPTPADRVPDRPGRPETGSGSRSLECVLRLRAAFREIADAVRAAEHRPGSPSPRPAAPAVGPYCGLEVSRALSFLDRCPPSEPAGPERETPAPVAGAPAGGATLDDVEALFDRLESGGEEFVIPYEEEMRRLGRAETWRPASLRRTAGPHGVPAAPFSGPTGAAGGRLPPASSGGSPPPCSSQRGQP